MPPPTADFPMTAALAAELVTAQFPQVQGTPERLGAGWDFEVYRVGEWLFRFPRREWSVRALDRELQYQPHVLKVMAPMKMPNFELVGQPVEGLFPHRFVGYRPVPGVGIFDAVRLDPGLPAALGLALSRLHSVDTALVTPHLRAREGTVWDRFVRSLADEVEVIRPLVPEEVREASEPYLCGERAAPPYDGPPRVIHNDLYAAHVMVDADTGVFQGLIDWTDLGVGDPVRDFVELVAIRGYSWVHEVRDHYALVDPTFDARLRWGSRVLCLFFLNKLADSDREMLVRWCRFAFEDTDGR